MKLSLDGVRKSCLFLVFPNRLNQELMVSSWRVEPRRARTVDEGLGMLQWNGVVLEIWILNTILVDVHLRNVMSVGHVWIAGPFKESPESSFRSAASGLIVSARNLDGTVNVYIQCLRESGSANEIVSGELVSVNDSKVERVVDLMSQDLEDELLLEDRIKVVPDDASSVCFFAQRADNERIHVKGSACHIALRRQVCHLLDLDKENTSNSTHTIELVSPQLGLSLQTGESVSLLPLFCLLGTAPINILVVFVIVGGFFCSGKFVQVLVSLSGIFKGDNAIEFLEGLLGGGSQVDVECGCACLLNCLSVGKDILESDIKLAHVVFAKAIFVPAHSLEQQTRDARYREVEASRASPRVITRYCRASEWRVLSGWGWEAAYGIAGAILIFGCEISALHKATCTLKTRLRPLWSPCSSAFLLGLTARLLLWLSVDLIEAVLLKRCSDSAAPAPGNDGYWASKGEAADGSNNVLWSRVEMMKWPLSFLYKYERWMLSSCGGNGGDHPKGNRVTLDVKLHSILPDLLRLLSTRTMEVCPSLLSWPGPESLSASALLRCRLGCLYSTGAYVSWLHNYEQQLHNPLLIGFYSSMSCRQ
ncbi:hypothetical protein KCU87_g359, partial [Aureobasidium melanogenum]